MILKSGDGKAIESHSTGRFSRTTGATSDPDADWGKHETGGIDARTGKAWKKVKSWFGYGLHLISDTRYEVPVAMHLTPAAHAEKPELLAMIKAFFAETPALAQRCSDFSADRGRLGLPRFRDRSQRTAIPLLGRRL